MTAIPYANVDPRFRGESWGIATGCSMGCKWCWSRGLNTRWTPKGQKPDFAPRFHPEKLDEPLHWKLPRCVLVAFNGDLFDPAITDEQIAAVFGVMASCPQHRFLVLTKRAWRMSAWFATQGRNWDPGGTCREEAAHVGALPKLHFRDFGPKWPLANVWLGVSVTNQDDADARIPHLLRCPAAVRWVSAEPLLGPINLRTTYRDPGWPCDESVVFALDWIVAGAQSGPGAPACDLAWARKLRDDCDAEGVPFMWKNPTRFPLLDGVRHDALPRVP